MFIIKQTAVLIVYIREWLFNTTGNWGRKKNWGSGLIVVLVAKENVSNVFSDLTNKQRTFNF